MAERVESKHLFNFPQRGILDTDLQEALAGFASKYTDNSEARDFHAALRGSVDQDDAESEATFVRLFRGAMTNITKIMSDFPDFDKYEDETATSEFSVPTTHDGEHDLPVAVYTPRKHTGAALIYAHGGGVVTTTAADYRKWLGLLAVEVGVVVFNVDYRLAPETKCPNNVRDYYEAVKYIKNNAESFGVSPDKLIIAGDSGGGYICLGAMVLMAQNNETDLVAMSLVGCPMVDDYCFSSPECMTKEERSQHKTLRKIWKLIAVDLKAQADDPLLFPGKASDELLAKFPPTIVRSMEFDQQLTETSRLAVRLRRAGRLLEFIVLPGVTHCADMMPNLECSRTSVATIRTAIQEYVL